MISLCPTISIEKKSSHPEGQRNLTERLTLARESQCTTNRVETKMGQSVIQWGLNKTCQSQNYDSNLATAILSNWTVKGWK
jgi:hypothetical protein